MLSGRVGGCPGENIVAMRLLLNSWEQNDGSLLKPQHRSSFRAAGLLLLVVFVAKSASLTLLSPMINVGEPVMPSLPARSKSFWTSILSSSGFDQIII